MQPPAVATDLRDQVQAVWNDGWNYKGLAAAVRLLQRRGPQSSPRARRPTRPPLSPPFATRPNKPNNGPIRGGQEIITCRCFCPVRQEGSDGERFPITNTHFASTQDRCFSCMPDSWARTIFETMPTQFGPVSLRFRLRDRSRTLDVAFEPRFRNAPSRVMLHIPPLAGLQRVVVNGESRPVQPGTLLQIR